MPGDRWLFPVLVVLGAVLLTALRRVTSRRQAEESWSPMPAARRAPSTSRLLVAGISALGIIWLVPWSTHLAKATVLELLIGIVFVGAISLCAIGE